VYVTRYRKRKRNDSYRSNGRRTRRKYRHRKGRRSNGFSTTGYWGKPFSTPFKTRKGSARAFRKHLWRSTEYKSHYRSREETSGILAAPASVEESSIVVQRALFQSNARGGGSPFFTTAGGAIAVDGPLTVPEFLGDIVLRGGIARCSVFNTHDTIAMRVRVFAVWTGNYPEDKYPSSFTDRLEWDPSLVAEADRFGKVLFSREAIVQPNSPMLVTYRFRPQKIDTGKFLGVDGITSDTPSAHTLFWFIKVSRFATGEGDMNAVWVTSYNVSFSGDAIGTL